MKDFKQQPQEDSRALGVILTLVFLAMACVLFFSMIAGKDVRRPEVRPGQPLQPADAPRIPFADITTSAGISFVHRSGAAGEKLLPESGGSGAALFDFDRDGDPDLLFVNGRAWPWNDDSDAQPDNTLALYRNDGGTFVDVTDQAALRGDYLGQGVAVGDFDADGDDDVLVTSLGGNHLYRNDAGRFVEVTAESGVAGDATDWTTSAGFFDYDRDGDLDLFVCNYVRWTREADEAAEVRVTDEFLAYAHPGNFEGTQNYLYRNDGGRFTDISAAAGIHVTDSASGLPLGKALAVTFVDFDRDGWLDIFVANDTVRHFLFRNRGDGTFEEIGASRGFAYNAEGATTSGMGIDAAWIRNGDRLAIAVGNFAAEMTELYISQTGDTIFFSDEAVAAGVGEPTLNWLTFGLLLDDFDLDGRADLVQTNGHLESEINAADAGQQYAQPGQLFWNAGEAAPHQFAELASKNIGDLSKPIVGRGIAAGDIDGDGDLDLVLTQVDGPPLVLRNDQRTGAHWLRCRLDGPAGNPHAVGAIVEVHANGFTQRHAIMPTCGYLSQSEPILTFGLGRETAVESMKIVWPDGSRQEVIPNGVDRLLTIQKETTSDSFESLANKAKAELENGRFEEAILLLGAALKLRLDSIPIRRNLARAYVLGGRAAEATEELERLESAAPQPSAANAYLLGLAALRQLDYERAVRHFSRAVELDPDEATLRFQYALALTSLGRNDDAREQFEKAAELDPLHGGAQYQLAIIARRAGEQETFRNYMRDYQRIRVLKGTADATALEECIYTKPETVEFPSLVATPSPEIASKFAIVETAPDGTREVGNLTAVAVLAMEDSGQYLLAGVTADGRVVVFRLNERGRVEPIAESDFSLGDVGSDATLLVGRAFHDSVRGQSEDEEEGDWPEVAIVTPQRSWLLRYRPSRAVEDLSQESNLSNASGILARWVDLDHDGDIDLLTCASDGLHVWRNNGDGTFVEATGEMGLDGFGPCHDFVAVDLDGTNLGVDLILAGPDGVSLARNQYAGRFADEPETTALWPAAERLLADDFNNDGLADLMFINASKVILLLTGDEERQELELDLQDIEAVATIDVDNDGWLDVAVFGADESGHQTKVLQNRAGRFLTAEESPPAVGHPRRGGALDLDADGDGKTDLLVIDSQGQLSLLRNETPTGNRQIKMELRSFVGHPSSIGVRIQVRREDLLVTRWTQRELPIEIGIGPHTHVDSIQTLWLNGVVKNEIDVLVAGDPLRITIVEFVRTSSCPFLYAWVDGAWQFVTDLLGTAPLNVAVARGVPIPPDPDEVVVLGHAGQFAEGRAAARLRITSELREVTYLNSVRLLAVVHPAEARVFSRDRAAMTGVTGPQFAVGRAPIVAESAIGSDGLDRTAALSVEDGVLAEPGRLLPPPVVGFTEPLTIEFDFGDLDDDADYLLALTGWFRFGSSSTNIAASQQSGLEVIWPRLEVADAEGRWQLLDDMVGFPAGNTKTIVCELKSKLPASAHRLRLTTSFEVRWDHIALYETVPRDELRVTEIEPTTAELAWHGFAELRARSFDQPQVPNLNRISDVPPWFTTVEGWCTRYGDIAPLVVGTDNRVAVLNSGDGAALEFSTDGLTPPPSESARTLLLYTRGWIKEEDPNSLADRRVDPLPDSDMMGDEIEEDWRLRYNTRWVPRELFSRDRHSD